MSLRIEPGQIEIDVEDESQGTSVDNPQAQERKNTGCSLGSACFFVFGILVYAGLAVGVDLIGPSSPLPVFFASVVVVQLPESL